VKKKIGWIIGIVVVVAGVLAYWRYGRGPATPPIQYKTAAVAKRRIVGKITASGTLSATVTVQVGTQVSGRIQSLNVDFNSAVKKGQVIAKIDPLLFQAAVQQASANYLSAKASLVRAKAQALDADRQYARLKTLKDQGLASQQDLETGETNAAVAKASIDVAQAALAQSAASLNQAQTNLSYTTIVSPIDGTVISRNVDVGQTVASSLQAPVLFTIAEDLKKMQVNTNIAEGDVGRLQSGMDSWFTVDAFPGQRFRGKISQIRNAAQTVQNVVTYDAVIDVDNADLKLRPGMTANATITYAEKDDALAVPNAAMRFKAPVELTGGASASASGARTGRPRGSAAAGGSGRPGFGDAIDTRTIWVLRGNQPVSIQVQLGLSDGTNTEVVKGELAEGDQVIIDATVTGAKASAAPAGGGGGMGGGGGSPLRRL
jgi:HlyD family secretion protein